MKHDGTKVVVFTKQEYRSATAPAAQGKGGTALAAFDEGEEGETEDVEVLAAGGGSNRRGSSGSRKRRKQERSKSSAAAGSDGGSRKSSSSSSSSRPRGGSRSAGPKGRNRMTFKDWQQRTMDEYLVK